MNSIKIDLMHGAWKLTDLKTRHKHGMKVFSCFHCGGGSTMGYKLAGYEVLGGVEIDPEMMSIYRSNHQPKHSYLMGVQKFKNIPLSELPPELLELDILDGSPPCSSFSSAGTREKDWGKKKKFREGQAHQVLDDLFFDFIDVARKLKPKVVIAENVKGLIIGNAKGYVKEIFTALKDAGYKTQLFLLNASRMGVPQARERTFFIAHREDLKFPKLVLKFEESIITLRKAFAHLPQTEGRPLTPQTEHLWSQIKPGESLSKAHARGSRFNAYKWSPDQPAKTLTANGEVFHWLTPRHLNDEEFIQVQTFPTDYDFGNQQVRYVCGMSVPPFMMQRLAREIYLQWLNPLNNSDTAAIT